MLLEMTKDFEVLKDSRLRSDDFGEGTYRHNVRTTFPPASLFTSCSFPSCRQVHQCRLGLEADAVSWLGWQDGCADADDPSHPCRPDLVDAR